MWYLYEEPHGTDIKAKSGLMISEEEHGAWEGYSEYSSSVSDVYFFKTKIQNNMVSC